MKTEQALIWNDVDLEKRLPNFSTLASAGRGTYSRRVNKLEVPRDGDIFTSAYLSSNQIGVAFLLVANTRQKLNEDLDKLKVLLQGEEVPFKFSDEPLYTRYGTVTGFEIQDEDTLTCTGRIIIDMSDPYKYSGIKRLETANGRLQVAGIGNSVAIKPEVVSLVTTTKGKPMLRFGKDYVIEFDISYPAGEKIIIDLKENSITRGGINEYHHLTLKSNMGDLRLQNDMECFSDTIDVFAILYRERVI